MWRGAGLLGGRRQSPRSPHSHRPLGSISQGTGPFRGDEVFRSFVDLGEEVRGGR